jgi:hypothetical protein
MGFLDKAKQLAEQAQQKLDEAQKNFNQSGSPQAQPGEGGVKYDEHGRPIQETPQADPAPAPPADPTSPSPPPDPASETDVAGAEGDPAGAETDVAGAEGDPAGAEGHPAGPEPTSRPGTPDTPDKAGGQANTSPDPFKPLQQ